MRFGKIRSFAVAISLGFSFFLTACPTEDNPGGTTLAPAIVTFVNHSSFRVDVFKNLNPLHFDPTVLVVTLEPNTDPEHLELPPSFDNVMGDTFFFHYQVFLANRFETGTTDIFARAQRVLTNVNFVIESGDRHTVMIPQPAPGELSFFHSYVVVFNSGNAPIQLINGTSILHRMDNNAVHIGVGEYGFFEMPFSPLDDIRTVNHLRAFSSHDVPFPEFTMERGYRHNFTVRGDTVYGPRIEHIDPLR
ncbi:MAG: hypothetical protein FWB78_03475 [Treponema sp.]|nr:hypothetical protein [Treponema sp.]